ncbi:MAG: TIGR02186 family protein [Nitrospirae bacterium]|nr:TIGR02186 family protein [Nitrospirota bacterium]MBF0536068.1 TIGR02186 family protein [Nitrospirota bacterium]MBF0617971.1 TIGR02186 family protein [Nitrospirota bacterium]
MNKKNTGLMGLILTVLVVTLIVSQTHANAELTLNMDKSVIPIDTFYKGNTLNITGSVDSGHDVVVKITSPRENESFMVKEKSVHLFWLNKYKLKVSQVNDTYMLFSSNNIDDILSAEERAKYSLGYDAVGKRVEITGNDKDQLFREFIKVKESGKLYVVSGTSVVLKPSGAGKSRYSVTVNFPYQVPIGSYNVNVFAVKDGVVSQRATGAVKIKEVGMVRDLSDMAMTHGGLYGVLAVLIALVAGYVVTPAIAAVKKVFVVFITLPKMVFSNGNGHLSQVSVLKESTKAEE